MSGNVVQRYQREEDRIRDALLHHSTDPADVQRLLQDAISLERTIDEDLEEMMARDGEMIETEVMALKEKTEEGIRKALEEAARLASSTAETAELADKVSFKIRQMDLKQSRVRAALHRIDKVRDRSRAVEGLKSALERDDLVAAVGCISQFLDIDEDASENSLEHGVSKDAADDEELASQRELLQRYKARCEQKVREKVGLAMKAKDHEDVTKYVQMFGPLRLEKEGVSLLGEYLTTMIGARAQSDYDALVDGFSLTGAKIDYVDALTNVLRDVAQSIDEYIDMLRDAFGPESALEAVHALHAECDVRCTRILHRFIDERGLAKICSQINNRMEKSRDQIPIESRKIEPLLSEILVLCNRGEEYVKYVLDAMGEAVAPSSLSPSMETSVRGGSMSSSLRELLSYYISLEEFYIEESVQKAIEIDEAVEGSLTSSMVDDTFYILLSSGKRALSTARAPSAVAILNQINNVVSTTYRSSLVQNLQGSPARLASCAPSMSGESPSSGVEASALALNDVDLSSNYILKLRGQLESFASQFFALHDMDRIKQVLSDLTKTSSDIQKLSDQAAEQLTASLMARVRPILDAFVSASYEISGDGAINEGWSTNLTETFDLAFTWLQSFLTPNLYEKVVESASDKIVARMEASVAQKLFTQLGGLQLERDVRSLILGLSEATNRSMRDKFSRLQQTATVLGLETPFEASELIGDAGASVGWRLTSLDIRQTLAQRVDFSQAQIAAVKLH